MSFERHRHVGIDEWCVSRGTDVLETVLGSCVSICLWDPKTKLGGLNHYLLPSHDLTSARSKNFLQNGPMTHQVIDGLMRQMIHNGFEASRGKALVLGGSDFSFDHFKVGDLNLQVAVAMLRQYQLSDIVVSGGGIYSRKVAFYVAEGKAVIHKLPLASSDMETQEIIHLGGIK